MLFTWNVENFSLCIQNTGKFITSPEFKIADWDKTYRHLRLYPRGRSNNSLTTCELTPDIELEDENVQLNIELSFISKTDLLKNITEQFVIKKGVSKNIYVSIARVKMLSENFLLLRDSLTIMCKIENSLNNVLPYKSCDIKTVINLQKYLITIPATKNLFHGKDGLTMISEHECLIDYKIKSEKICKFQIRCRLMSTKELEVKVEQLNLLSFAIIFFLDVQIRNNLNTPAKAEHLFCANTMNSVWKKTFNIEEMADKLKEIKSLVVHISISNGDAESISTVNKIVYPVGNPQKLQITSSPFLSKMYIDKKFTDITIEVEKNQKSFPTHKSILSAASPVFNAMLETNMKEKQTDTIRIDDIDAETIEKMLKFIYCRTIDNLKSEEVLKLYSAADKYQILELKEFCSSYLSDNLSIEFIGKVLYMADLCHDQGLKSSALEFLSNKYKEVFVTKGWQMLMEQDSQLAAEVMTSLFLKI